MTTSSNKLTKKDNKLSYSTLFRNSDILCKSLNKYILLLIINININLKFIHKQKIYIKNILYGK
jgi:hypothetical protein